MRKYHAETPASAVDIITAWHTNRKGDPGENPKNEFLNLPSSNQYMNGLHGVDDGASEGSETKSLREVLEGNQRRCACACSVHLLCIMHLRFA